MASSYDSDTKNVLVAIASLEVRQQMLSEKLDERLEALEERMDERHESLLERLEAREAARDEAMRGFVREVVKESMARVHSRLDDVEKKQQQLTYAAGGMATLAGVAAWFYEHIVSKLLPVFAIVLFGCAGAPGIVQDQLKWPEMLRPVTLLVDETLPGDCKQAVQEAVVFWRGHGVSYLQLDTAPAGTRPWMGEVFVSWKTLDFPALGECEREKVGNGIMRAYINLSTCAPQTAIHEVGHALGLEHSTDPQNVMYPAQGQRFKVSSADLEQVK